MCNLIQYLTIVTVLYYIASLICKIEADKEYKNVNLKHHRLAQKCWVIIAITPILAHRELRNEEKVKIGKSKNGKSGVLDQNPL